MAVCEKKKVLFQLICLIILCGAVSASSSGLKAVEEGKSVKVYVGEELFTVYKADETQKYPYFFPVNGPLSGDTLTTESSEPYPHHHSLFFGCDRVNGGNYWQESLAHGQICSVDLTVVKSEGDQVLIRNSCEWRKPGAPPVLRDMRQILISAPDKTLRIIDFEITLVPLEDVRIEKTNHSLFAARMKPEMSVAEGGTLVNAAGERGESGTFGKTSPWCDYYGENKDFLEGLAIFQHPSNPLYPAQWFTRDYGFFSPTNLYWPPNDSHIELKKEESVTLRYRVVVHAGDTESAKIAGLFNEYAVQKDNP